MQSRSSNKRGITVLYPRLSRDDDMQGDSNSIVNQREMLGHYVREQGWNLYDTYCDDGVSGTTFDRPSFNRLIAGATAGKINPLLCKDLSRLGRDYIEAGKYTDVAFPSLGCRFIVLNDGAVRMTGLELVGILFTAFHKFQEPVVPQWFQGFFLLYPPIVFGVCPLR